MLRVCPRRSSVCPRLTVLHSAVHRIPCRTDLAHSLPFPGFENDYDPFRSFSVDFYRPLTPAAQQAQQMSILSRTAESLQVQLASVQSKLQSLVESIASPTTLPSSAIASARRQSLRPQSAAAAALAAGPAAAVALDVADTASAPAADPFLAQGYQPLSSAATTGQTAADRHAAAIAAIAASLSAHTFKPAAVKVRVRA